MTIMANVRAIIPKHSRSFLSTARTCAFTPAAVHRLVAIPCGPVFPVLQLHRDAVMFPTLRRRLGRGLRIEPLASRFYLGLDAGEVHPAQGDHDFLAVDQALERDTHRCFGQRCRGCWLYI